MPSHAQQPVSYAQLDQHARSATTAEEYNLDALAAYLGQPAKTDLEKARVIFAWITDNVVYDDKAYNSGKYPAYDAASVLKSRKAVCEGFSNLYLELGRRMGLDIRKVSGYAKGFGYRRGQTFRDTDHAWNVINIDGTWRVFDATWGAGSGENRNGRLVSVKQFDPYYFNLDPYKAIFSHLPEDSKYAFVEPVPDLAAFQRLPVISDAYFKMGFEARELYKKLMAGEEAKLPEAWSAMVPVRVIKAPALQDVKAGVELELVFQVPAGRKMAVIDSRNEWTWFESAGGNFTLHYTPSVPGILKISVAGGADKDGYETVLEYRVTR